MLHGTNKMLQCSKLLHRRARGACYLRRVLEPVVLHQTRFNAPGLAPDPRGIALGKECAVLVPSLDALVNWFRVLSDEISLDDLLPALHIAEVEGALGSRELLLRFEAGSSHQCDRASRLSMLVGGLCFTGAGRHFVKYRDASAPFGYDIAPTEADRGDGQRGLGAADVILHAPAFTQGYKVRRELPFGQLVFRLSPRRLPGPVAGDREERSLLWMLVAPGLARSVLGYLYRNRVAGEAVMVQRLGPGSSLDAQHEGRDGRAGKRLLVRVHDLPERMLALFCEVPGVSLYRPVEGAPQVVVELGYRHPLRLESCLGLFDRRRFYVFAGRADGVEVLTEGVTGGDAADRSGASPSASPSASGDGGPLPLAAIAHLVSGDFVLEKGAPVEGRASPAPELRLALRLVVSSTSAPGSAPAGAAGGARRAIVAVLVPWARAEWLKRIVFALPPQLLASCRCAPVDEGLLVVTSSPSGQSAAATAGAVDRLPLGELLYEAAPSVLAPVGFELSPRVTPEVLSELVGGVGGRQLVLRPGPEGKVRAIAIEEALFEPLSRRLLGPIPVEARTRSGPLREDAPPRNATVVNDPAGVFPLWGFRPASEREEP